MNNPSLTLSALLRLVAALAAIALFAAACGGSSGEVETSSAAQNDDTESDDESAMTETDAAGTELADEAQPESDAQTGSDAQAAPESGDDGAEEAPAGEPADEDATQAAIDQALELMTGDFDSDAQQAIWAEQERITQEKVRECMTAEGFEYYIVDHSQYATFDEGDWDPTDRDWVAENGFGASTQILGDVGAFAEDFGEDEYQDPNWEYQNSLSEGESKAYDRALYGDQPDIEFTGNEPTDEEIQAMEEAWENRTNLGCYDAAWQESQTSSGMDAVWSVIDDQYEDIEARIKTDPRITDSLNAWVKCMAESGHAYTDPEEMYNAVYERSEEIWSSYEDPFAELTEEDFDAMSDEQLEALSGPPDFDEELVAEINEWEIALALDSFDCGEPALQEIAEEIWTELTVETIEANRDKIAEAIAAGN